MTISSGESAGVKLGFVEHSPGGFKINVIRELHPDAERALLDAVWRLSRFWLDSMPITILLENRDELIKTTVGSRGIAVDGSWRCRNE